MNMKKWLLAGSCIAMFGALSACSDDPTSPKPDSSASEPTSAENPTSSGDVGANSSSAATVKSSSSVASNAKVQMACSEIMYNAPETSALEWVEIYIASGVDMDNMQNFLLHLSGAVDYTFPGEPLKKGEYVVVANDTAEFRKMYPTFTGRLFGPWVGGTSAKLVNEGDVVNVKVDGEGDVSCAFSNEPPWPSLADGKGRSLVYKGGNAAQPNSWAASKADKGAPGVGNDEWVEPSSVRINEIMPNVGANPAWIELYNTGSEAVDVAGWTLDVKRRGDKLTIKSGAVSTVIPPKGYVVLDAVDNFTNEENPDRSELVVALDGGEFYLRGLVEGEESSIWVPASSGPSGVVDLSDGSTAQGPLAAATPGEKNSALQVGSLYINEIYYHPGSNTKDIPFEFLELVNNSDVPVVLFNSKVPKGWKVEGINLEFASNATIPAKGMMLLIPETLEDVDQQAFGITNWGADYVRTAYQVPEDVQIVTYKGKLSNRGETIAVKEPYSKEEDQGNPAATKYFYIWHDATLYSDNWDSLAEADGFGYSLQRVDTSTMGYEAKAWKAALPTIGVK